MESALVSDSNTAAGVSHAPRGFIGATAAAHQSTTGNQAATPRLWRPDCGCRRMREICAGYDCRELRCRRQNRRRLFGGKKEIMTLEPDRKARYDRKWKRFRRLRAAFWLLGAGFLLMLPFVGAIRNFLRMPAAGFFELALRAGVCAGKLVRSRSRVAGLPFLQAPVVGQPGRQKIGRRRAFLARAGVETFPCNEDGARGGATCMEQRVRVA